MKPRILLLEDDIVLRDFLASSLMTAQYEVMRVSKPEQALSLLNMTGFDLAIFDAGLPEMDGIETMRQARANGFDGKFILISANPDKFIPSSHEHKLMEELGILDIFKKPFPFSQLVEFIGELQDREFSALQRFKTDDSLTKLQPMAFDKNLREDAAFKVARHSWQPLEELKGSLNRFAPSELDQFPKQTPDGISSHSSSLSLDQVQMSGFHWGDNKELQNNAFLPSASSAELSSALPLLVEENLSEEELEQLHGDATTVQPMQYAPDTQSPLPEPNPKLSAQLSKLKLRYGPRLEHQLCELIRLLQPIRHHKEPTALEQAIYIAHKLRGTSGTFGFHEVSQTTGWLEDTFYDLQKQTSNLPTELWEEVYIRLENALLSQQTHSIH